VQSCHDDARPSAGEFFSVAPSTALSPFLSILRFSSAIIAAKSMAVAMLSPPAGSSASARQETSSTGAAHARLLGGRLPAEHGVAEDGAWLHAHRAIFFVFLNERKFVELP
jgi:hypothetical protein